MEVHDKFRAVRRHFILVINIYDDMLVYGAIQIQHDYALARVLQRMEDLGLTLNKAKCKFSHPEAIFFGMRFTKEGMSLTQDRVQALMEAAPPKSVQEVRSFLGMTNFSSPHEEECHVSLVTRRGRSIPRH